MVTQNDDIAAAAVIKQIEEDVALVGVELGAGEKQTVRANDDKITVYSMINGEPREVLKNDAPRLLAKKLASGGLAFWYEGMPGEAPAYAKGDVSCMLHPDFDESEGASGLDRAFIDTVGLSGRTCNMNAVDKNNRDDFRSVYDRDDHMAKKHRREWSTIQAAIETRDRNRERDERREDREAMQALAGAAVTQVLPTTENAATGLTDASKSKSKDK
jgi:hypothetical protein|tara:strand:+ start:473 stop:1120 length:648 start_codon:yes stop_codon:yes gene_type:complete